MTRFLALLLFATPTAALAQGACPSPKPATGVAGSYSGTKITVAELDKELAGALCQARMEYDRKVHELRARTLEGKVSDALLKAEAKKRGLKGIEALLTKIHGEAKVDEATALAFYTANKQRIGDKTFDEVKQPILEHLKQGAAQEAVTELLTTLKKAAKFKDNLGAYRVTVKTTGPTRGPKNAPIEVVVFADYECPYCSRGAHALEEARLQFKDKVKVIYKDYPLDFHANAVGAAVAARCAGEQGKYWEMHDALYEKQDALSPATYEEQAAAIGLDKKKFDACSANPAHAAKVAEDTAFGASIGVSGTPAFFVNGVLMSGAQPVEAFVAAFKSELAN